MNLTLTIFDALGGTTAIARDTGCPVQTVHSWKQKGAIPYWRRPALLEMARRKGKPLPVAAIAYLNSTPAEAE